MANFSASDLRDRITVQRPDNQTDGAGGYDERWHDLEDLWAAMIPVSSSEQVNAAHVEGKISHKFILRFREDISAQNRFRHGERVFRIASVRDLDERRNFLECLCEETIA